jgi:hypothetical protein
VKRHTSATTPDSELGHLPGVGLVALACGEHSLVDTRARLTVAKIVAGAVHVRRLDALVTAVNQRLHVAIHTRPVESLRDEPAQLARTEQSSSVQCGQQLAALRHRHHHSHTAMHQRLGLVGHHSHHQMAGLPARLQSIHVAALVGGAHQVHCQTSGE